MGELCSSSAATARLCRSIYTFEIKHALISEDSPLAKRSGTTTPRIPNKQYRKAYCEFANTMDTILLTPIDRFATEGTLAEIRPALLAAMKAVVLHQSKNYLASFPGRDKIASNFVLHWRISTLPTALQYTIQNLDEIHTQVEYRLNSIRLADCYISFLGLRGPYGETCAWWDGTPPHAARQRGTICFVNLGFDSAQYSRSRFLMWSPRYRLRNLDEEGLADAIAHLVAVKGKVTEEQVEMLSQCEMVKEATQRFFSALGRR
ncbi:MAG: hypothetical protein Q9213_001217 [Squamulea squamosa]